MFISDREVIDRMGELIARDNRVVSDHDVLRDIAPWMVDSFRTRRGWFVCGPHDDRTPLEHAQDEHEAALAWDREHENDARD